MLNAIKRMFDKLTPAGVATYYDDWTQRYLEGFGEIFQAKQAASTDILIDYYLTQMGVTEGMHLLDAGCGIAGPAVHFAQKRDIHIDAVTVSQTQVDMAAQNITAAGVGHRVKIHQGDYHHMEKFGAESYDVVYFLESLVHSPNPKLAIKQAKRLLKPDGILYVKDLFEKTPYAPQEKKDIKKWVRHNNRYLKLNIIEKERLLTVLRDEGFQLEFCQLMRIPTNQDRGNRFVVVNEIMPDPIKNTLPPYLEWYEIKAIKPGPGIVDKM